MKRCCKCNLIKEDNQFNKNSKSKDGLRSECKECRKKETQKYRKDNKEKLKEKKREWYSKTKDRKEKRTEKELIKNKKFCNKCGIEKPIKEYRERANGGFYSICKKCENEKNKIYRKENKEKYLITHRHTEQRRRYKIKGLKTDFTTEQWEEVKKFFNNKCAYCGCEEELTQDHFIPVSCGGAYTKRNIIPSCRICNSSKNNKEFEQWYQTSKVYNKDRKEKIKEYFQLC